MINIFKSGVEFNRVSEIINSINKILDEANIKSRDSVIHKEEFKEEVCFIAYLIKKGINDRIEKYNWPLGSMISVTSISKHRITLALAIAEIYKRVGEFVNATNLLDDYTEIIEGRNLYFTFERALPEKLKRKFRLN